MAISLQEARKRLRARLSGDTTPDFGEVAADVDQSFGQQAVETGTKGIGHLGDLLDIPGAFVRGLVGSALSLGQGDVGRAGERLVSAFPGSEEIPKMFGGEGFRAPTGQDILTDLGNDPSNTMDEERRIRIAMASGMTRPEAERRFTTRYEEESLDPERQFEFKTILQRALEMNPDLKTGITQDDIKRATEADDFLGFAVEIGLDPLTYMTFGASAVGKAAKATKAIKEAAQLVAGPGEKGAKAAGRIMNIIKSADTLDHARAAVKAIPGADVDKSRLLNVLDEAWKGGKPDLELGDTLMKQIERGQFKAGFKIPGIEQPVLEDAATKAIELVGNGIGGIGSTAMKFKPVAQFVARHPGAKNWPKKLWLRIAGEAKKADALGNERLTEIFLHEQHFNRTAGYEALKWQGELKRNTARILNGLTEEQRNTVKELVPELVENPTFRSFARDSRFPDIDVGVSDKATRDALFDYADVIQASNEDLLALQQKWGLGVHELAEDFGFFARNLSDEVIDFMSKRPDARKAWLGAKTRMGKEMLSRGILGLEKGRVLKGMDFKEAEKTMREVLGKYGLPDDLPIWNPDPTQVLLRRSDKSIEAAKIRNLTHVASEVYGYSPEGAARLASQVVREAAESRGAKAAERVATAERLLREAEEAQIAFREGRGAVRGALRRQERDADKLVGAGEQMRGVADEADTLAAAGKESRIAEGGPGEIKLPDEAEQALRALADDAVARIRSQPGKGGTGGSNSVVKRAQRAANKFEDAYQKAVTLPEYRRAVRDLLSDIRKIAPKSVAKDYERQATRALRMLDDLESAQGAVRKPVAQAVNQRVRDAEKKAKLAREMLAKSNVDDWTPQAKAEYVMARLKEQGLAPPPGEISALELAMKSNIQLSDNLEDLAALGVRYLDEADGKEFTKYANRHYWKHLDKQGKAGKVYDAIKGIYQRSTLARVASLSRDLIGTASQGLMAGNHKYLGKAMKDLGFTSPKAMREAAEGLKALPDDILRLQAAGVLRTTKGEIRDGLGVLKGTPLLGKIEESGVVGGTLRAFGADKTGKKVGEGLGVLNDARIGWEEVNRVATYRKAIAEGMTHDDAIAEVFKYWGNFSELSKLEGKYLNRIMFFWSWMARSVPTALQTMLHHPVRARLALTLIAGNVSNTEAMPEWMQRMGGWTLGQDENGNYQVLNLGNSTYFSPTMSALQSDLVKEVSQGNLGRAVGEAGRELARSAPPFVGGIYENVAEKDTFTNERWWSDPKNRIGTRLKAPAGFYWLKDTALGDALGVEVVSEPTEAGPKIKTVYMDPEVANFLSFIPGLEPALTDASSFADPRSPEGPGASPGKGIARTLGVPVYSVEQRNELERDAKRYRRLLAQSVDAMPGNALASNGSNIYPNKHSEEGRKLRETRDSLYAQARDSGMSKREANEWTYAHLSTVYPEESRWLRLDARIRILEKLSEEPEEDEDEGGLRLRPVQRGLGVR